MPDMSAHELRRARMVSRQLEARGIRDPAVLAAMGAVPREAFVPPELADQAYEDGALPIGEGQTISQPYIVALMAEGLRLGPGDRVLEVGVGSGYAAAVMARIAEEVWGIERLPHLAERAAATLASIGCANVRVATGDGTLGWPEHAPYDAIAVAAAGPGYPPALLDQLAPGGRLVIPVDVGGGEQDLMRVTRDAKGTLSTDKLCGVRFVPLVGAQGWD